MDHALLYIAQYISLPYIEGSCKVVWDSLYQNPFETSFFKWQKEWKPTSWRSPETRQRPACGTNMPTSTNLTMQSTSHIPRSTIWTISHLFLPPKSNHPCLPVRHPHRQSEESERPKHGTRPKLRTQHPSSWERIVTSRWQLYQVTKSHFSAHSSITWWIAALISRGERISANDTIGRRDKRGQEVSECDQILPIDDKQSRQLLTFNKFCPSFYFCLAERYSLVPLRERRHTGQKNLSESTDKRVIEM